MDGGSLLTVSSVCQDVDSLFMLFFAGTPPFGRTCFPRMLLYIYAVYIFVFLNFDGTNYAPFCGDIDKPLRLGIRYFSLSDAMYALRKQIVLAERHGLFRAASAATITKHFLSMVHDAELFQETQ